MHGMSALDNFDGRLCFFLYADWYFEMHWLDRALAAIGSGYDVHLITGKTSDAVIGRLENSGITCHEIFFKRGSLNPFNILISTFQLHYKIRLLSPDIIHSVTLLPAIEAGFLSLFNSHKLVSSITGLGWIFSKSSLKASVLRYFVRFLFRFFLKYNIDVIIFENSDDKKTFLSNSMCADNQSIVINGAGVDTERFCKTDNQGTRKNIRFLYAARLLMSKGLPSLIESCNFLYGQDIKFELVVCGIYDPLSPDAIPEKLINEWIQLPFVRWLGQKSDMPSIINDWM